MSSKLLGIVIFALLGIFMITSPSLGLVSSYVYADEEGGGGGNDGGSNDGGGNKDDGGGHEDKQEKSNDNDNNNNKQESNDSPKEEQKQEQEKPERSNEDNQVVEDDVPKEKEENTAPQVPDNDGTKGTAEEQEKAAQEDYIYDEPGVVKPYPPGTNLDPTKHIKKIPHDFPVPVKGVEETKQGSSGGGDPCNYYGRDICEGSKDGKTCNDEKFDCLSEYKDPNGEYQNCPTGQCPNDDQPYDCKKSPDKCDYGRPPPPGEGRGGPNGDWCKQHPDKCGKGGEGDWCKEHPDKCDHPHHPHKHHNNWCHWHNCHNHHHHSSTHFSDSHNGDVTVKIVTKYDEKNPKNLNDVDLIIGDVYEKFLDLSDKPSEIKVDHLDIDGGDSFAVCLANEDSQEGECTVAEADNDHDTVKVYLTVK